MTEELGVNVVWTDSQFKTFRLACRKARQTLMTPEEYEAVNALEDEMIMYETKLKKAAEDLEEAGEDTTEG